MKIEAVTGTCKSDFVMFSAGKVGNLTSDCWNGLGCRDSEFSRDVFAASPDYSYFSKTFLQLFYTED